MSMLALSASQFAGALGEVADCGGATIAEALATEAQQKLREAAGDAPFERAPERVGQVEQDVEVFSLGPGTRPLPRLQPIVSLTDAYVAFVREQTPWLADFEATHIDVQRYGRSSRGITPHRDGRRFVKLISVFALGDPAELTLCRDRQGTPVRRFRLTSGALFLLRAPGFDGRDEPGPLHAVSGPMGELRYSIGIRMERR
ncbi:MAG: hypothetical protein Q8S13_12290 [Dehalococcoidia bacterium]|nr:hypothetical protein [Dehalococcoidia bacterium]